MFYRFTHVGCHIFYSPPKQATVQVSGAPQKGNADFPVEAVQSFHDKPLPTHDKGAPSKPVVIHQPRK